MVILLPLVVTELTATWSGGGDLILRLVELGVHSTLRQMPLLEAETKEEAKWARDQVQYRQCGRHYFFWALRSR